MNGACRLGAILGALCRARDVAGRSASKRSDQIQSLIQRRRFRLKDPSDGRVRRKALLLALVGLVACGGDSSDDRGLPVPLGEQVRVSTERTALSDSVRILPDPNGEVVPEFEFVEDFRLGAGESDEVFQNDYLILTFRPDGSLLVNSYYGDRLLLFDSAGTFVRQLAGPGRGPGELIKPTALGVAPDGGIWVANAFDRRYTKFDSTGAFARTAQRPFGALVQRQKRLVFQGEGSTFIDQSADLNGRLISMDFNVMDTLGNVVESYPQLDLQPFHSRDLPFRPGVGFGNAPDYYTFTAFSFDEKGLWFGRSDKLEIYRRDWSGDTTVVIVGDHRSATELTREDRSAIETSLRRAGYEWDDFYFSRPLLHGLYPLPNGGVLVQLTDRTYREDTPFFEIYSDSGHLVGTVEFPLPISVHSIPAFRGERVAVVATDSFDVPYVLVGTLRRSTGGGEGVTYDFGRPAW